jgi:transcriptional regulator with XRE-family HTH domain
MCRIKDGEAQYAPLCIHAFRLIAPRKLLEAQLFNQRYHSYEEIESVTDRLRWCRHRMGWTQAETAGKLGITRANYIDLETGAVERYKKETVDKLAKLFGVPPADFLDDFNRFVYKGQGAETKAYRLEHGLSQSAMARLLRVDTRQISDWETEKKWMTRASGAKHWKELLG